jgi:hypothetical protein
MHDPDPGTDPTLLFDADPDPDPTSSYDPDLDLAKWCRSDRIRIHKTA